MIPKIIHQIWLQGYDNIPEDLKQYHNKCMIINSDFQHIFWDESKIIKLLEDKFDQDHVYTFKSYNIPAQKADFARYAILYVYGGIYLDMDSMCIKNLSPFLKYQFFFTVTDDFLNKLYRRYQTGVIGSIPKHPLYKILLKNIFDRTDSSHIVTYSTGTRVFYDSVQEYLKNNKNDITIIDPKYLHPCGIFDDQTCPNNCDSCYIVHVNYSSWSKTLRIAKYVTKHFIYFLILFVLIVIIIIMIYNQN